jgi:hypothetical protein
MRTTLLFVGWAMLVVDAACTKTTVDWDEPTSAAADSLGSIGISQVGVVFGRALQATAPASDSARCEQTTVFARDGNDWYAAWNQMRPDGSVTVLAAKSSNGGASWSAPGIVDSTDVARLGCARPGPSIAAANGYVHIAYSVQAPEGYGVFFAHSMDGTRTFHSAVPVVYGDRLSETAVATDGMNVIVAYENPSGTGRRVDLAISRTQGHTFEARVNSSPDEMTASRPEAALRGNTLAVSFADPASGNRIVRVGHLH